MSKKDPRREALYKRLEALGVNVVGVRSIHLATKELLDLTERLEKLAREEEKKS